MFLGSFRASLGVVKVFRVSGTLGIFLTLFPLFLKYFSLIMCRADSVSKTILNHVHKLTRYFSDIDRTVFPVPL